MSVYIYLYIQLTHKKSYFIFLLLTDKRRIFAFSHHHCCITGYIIDREQSPPACLHHSSRDLHLPHSTDLVLHSYNIVRLTMNSKRKSKSIQQNHRYHLFHAFFYFSGTRITHNANRLDSLNYTVSGVLCYVTSEDAFVYGNKDCHFPFFIIKPWKFMLWL